MKPTSFSYNKLFSYSVTAGILLFLILLIIRNYQLNDHSQSEVLKYFGVFLLLILGAVIFKFLIPSINKKPALEMNELSLIDKVRNREAYWKNIKEIRLIKFRNGGTGIAIDLIDKDSFKSTLNVSQVLLGWISDITYGTPFIIPLQYISGSNKDIFETIQIFRNEICLKIN